MGAITNVLYYGIFGAFTGGWLPVRSKKPNRLLVISHLYAFLIFVAAPLTVFLVSHMLKRVYGKLYMVCMYTHTHAR